MAYQRNSVAEPLTSIVSSSSSQENHGSRHQWYKPNVITLLLWNSLVGCVFTFILLLPVDKYIQIRTFHSSLTLGAYSILGIVQMLHPIGGLLADVRCGRHKVIMISILIIWCGFFLLGIEGIIYAVAKNASTIQIILGIMVTLSSISFIVGFSGFKSNSVQFSLDQLPDASSEKISLFLHWFVWTEFVGNMIMRLLFIPMLCLYSTRCEYVGFSTLVFVTLSTAFVLLAYFIHDSFYCERISSIPYWNVWKVLCFAAKHDKPLGHRSAFTYSDDEKPSRIDLAKRIYGGTFETEVVEDVKTFLRVVLMLFATTPVFFLEVSTSYLFPIFGLHLGKNSPHDLSCTYNWILFESENLSTVIPVLAIPVYILLYPFIKKWVPRIVIRLSIGVMLMVASAFSMLCIQAVANYSALQNPAINHTCLFWDMHSFEFPTQVLVVPNVLYGIAAPLISIALLEFISAQSPHTMKGLLLGVFYAFKGLFITLGSVATLPFAEKRLWGDQHGMFDCGFYYYLSNSVFGVLGLVVFILAARWYRNRERDDPPYRYQYAEEYFSRCASQPTSRLLNEHFQESYGTMDS